MSGRLTALIAATWVTWVAAGEGGSIIPLEAAGHRITVELALTPAERERGLMQRQTLPEDHGMLFVFEVERQHCMWMKNTHIPLSVAFLDGQGMIINIIEMRPMSLEVHCADRPARYALEMRRGWFARRGITSGMHIHGVDRLPGLP